MKKLKKWVFEKYFKGEFENYLTLLENTIKNKNAEIKNLKKQINHLTMKGPLL